MVAYLARRLVLAAESVQEATRRYRLVPLPGEPGEGAPIRAFRAFPRHTRRASAPPAGPG